MYFSRKIIPIALLILGGFGGIGPAAADPHVYMPEHEIYTKGDGSHVIDAAQARRLLQGVNGTELKEVWFATGLEDYYKSPACVTARDVYVFTKPLKSSEGIWRGQRSYLSGEAKDWTDKDCNDVVLRQEFTSETGTFIDPEAIRPEESMEGRVPGIFQITHPLTDEQLLRLRDAIVQIHDCFKESTSCNYPVDVKYMTSPRYEYIPAIRPSELLVVGPSDKAGCFGLTFAENEPFAGMFVMNVCFGDKSIASVAMDDMLID